MRKKLLVLVVTVILILHTNQTLASATASPMPLTEEALSSVDAMKAVVSMILFIGLLLVYMLYMTAKARRQSGTAHYKPTRGRSGALLHDDEGEKAKSLPDHAHCICPFCAAENPIGNHFCGKCGSML